MEFYFSDANITKNRLMLEMVSVPSEDPDAEPNTTGFVPLIAFLEFNRIKELTASVDDLKKSLVNSEKLEISPDGLGVRRKVPYDPNKVS